tara:strand:+ start:540 stop:2195 length:1656 start_codon:yes stop_codon:yes gene_type:complete
MSTDAMTQYFRNKQAAEDRKVARKIAALDRIAEADARKELMLLNMQIESARKEGSKVDQVVANKQVAVENLRKSLNILSDGFAFKDVPASERTEYTKPDGGYENTIKGELARREDELKVDRIYLERLKEEESNLLQKQVEVQRALDWFDTKSVPKVDRTGDDKIDAADWSPETFMDLYPSSDKALVEHISSMRPMNPEKESLLELSQEAITKIAQDKTDSTEKKEQDEEDRQRQIERWNKQDKRWEEADRKAAEAEKAKGLATVLSSIPTSPMFATYSKLETDESIGEDLNDGTFVARFREGATIEGEYLTKDRKQTFPSRSSFTKARLKDYRLTSAESRDITGWDNEGRAVNILLSNLEDVFAGKYKTEEELADAGYGNLQKYLSAFRPNSPDYATMHDVATLLKENRDYLRSQEGGEGKARAYMQAVKDHLGISFGQDDSLINYYIDDRFSKSDIPLDTDSRIYPVVKFFETQGGLTRADWGMMMKDMKSNLTAGFRGQSENDRVNTLWGIIRAEYRKEKGVNKIENADDFKQYGLSFIKDMHGYFTGD